MLCFSDIDLDQPFTDRAKIDSSVHDYTLWNTVGLLCTYFKVTWYLFDVNSVAIFTLLMPLRTLPDRLEFVELAPLSYR